MILEDPDRRVVPRWRPWREAVSLGDACPATIKRTPPQPSLENLGQTAFDWKQNRTMPFAADFLGAAFALGQATVAKDAAEFVLSSRSPTNEALQKLATLVLSGQSVDNQTVAGPALPSVLSSRSRIRELRKSLNIFQRNPLALMDLAREYVALGQPWAAIKPIREALALAPASRFVLRCAARFFLHIKDSQQAHDLLRNAPVTKSDPWLVSAEIAVACAAGRSPYLVKTGRQFVESKKFHPTHISELASALGTLELEAGKTRLMKQLFRKALESPTENSVAQAAWISRKIGNWAIEENVLMPPRSYEADAWTSIIHHGWDKSLSAAELWLYDEPFAKRPTVFGSWVALTMAPDFGKAEVIAKYGLERHKNDFLLLNNLTVALAYQGRHQEALKTFQNIPHEEIEGHHRATYLATSGLLKFRIGAPDEGRKLYRMAINETNKKNEIQSSVWALLHLAREEYRLAPLKGHELLKEAQSQFPKLLPAGQAMASRLVDVMMQEHATQNRLT